MIPPTHDEIAHRAHQLWQEYGRPENRDHEIWLTAENQLVAKSRHPASVPEWKAFSDRARAEEAPEDNPDPAPITPSIADVEIVQAELEKRAARAPQRPHPTGGKRKAARLRRAARTKR